MRITIIKQNKFLIFSKDESIAEYKPVIVAAENETEALQIFLRVKVARDSDFREAVLDLAANSFFVERFYLTTPHERERFESTGAIATEPEIIRSRIKVFFYDYPDLCDLYLRYMDTEDHRIITDQFFEFVASKMSYREHGLIALNLDMIEVI